MKPATLAMASAAFAGGLLSGLTIQHTHGTVTEKSELPGVRVLRTDRNVPTHIDSIEVKPFRTEVDGIITVLGDAPETDRTMIVTAGKAKVFVSLPAP